MDKLSDYFAILKLIEQARKGGRKAGQFNRTLDTGIYNQALSTGMLRGSEGIGGLPASSSEVIDFIPQNKRNPKRAGMEYMSDGGGIMGLINEARAYAESKYAAHLGMDDDAIAWANSVGEKYGEAGRFDGTADAARHIALGWLTTQTPDPERAFKSIQNREDFGLDRISEFFNPEHRGRRMDLHNNRLGYELPAKTRDEAEKLINQLILSKEAEYMTPEESRKMRGYAMGGEARYDIRRGVGAFAPYTRSA